MKNCKVCGQPLKKTKNTVHYGCRNAKTLLQRISKKGVDAGVKDTAKTRTKSGLKTLEKRKGLFAKLFN